MYNSAYYHDNALHSLNPKRSAIHTFLTSDGIVIGLFQGKRGQYPELDFVIKVLKPGKDEKSFAPKHTLWVVDLMLKIEDYRHEVKEILEYYIDFYKKVKPFDTQEERLNYRLVTLDFIKNKYSKIEQKNTLSLDYVAIVIELFCINEKRTAGAYWFKDLLQTLLDYVNEKKDYISVLRAAQPGY